MSKFKRHARMLEIISQETIFTQEQLLESLRKSGFDVTQATVSRDIRELRLVKVQTPDGNYVYADSRAKEAVGVSFRYHAIIREAVSSIDYAQNLVVVKCFTGMANAACAAFDTLELTGVVGTIAGDDTVLIITRDTRDAIALKEELYGLLRRSQAGGNGKC